MAQTDYLDTNGLLYYNEKLKGVYAKKTEVDANVIEGVSVNNSPLTPDANKVVNVPVPTTVAQMTDSDSYATKAYVNDAVGNVVGISFEIVQTLPASGAGTPGTIYLISHGGSGQNVYDEYAWISSTNSFEKLGTTDVDLSGYVQSSDLGNISNSTIDAIVAGTYQ